MVSKAVKKCLQLLESMFDLGFHMEISERDLKDLIAIQMGADKRTINKYLKMLTETLEFLKVCRRNREGKPIYRIEVEHVERFIDRFAKEEAKRLKQLTLLEIKCKEEEVLEKV